MLYKLNQVSVIIHCPFHTLLCTLETKLAKIKRDNTSERPPPRIFEQLKRKPRHGFEWRWCWGCVEPTSLWIERYSEVYIDLNTYWSVGSHHRDKGVGAWKKSELNCVCVVGGTLTVSFTSRYKSSVLDILGRDGTRLINPLTPKSDQFDLPVYSVTWSIPVYLYPFLWLYNRWNWAVRLMGSWVRNWSNITWHVRNFQISNDWSQQARSFGHVLSIGYTRCYEVLHVLWPALIWKLRDIRSARETYPLTCGSTGAFWPKTKTE